MNFSIEDNFVALNNTKLNIALVNALRRELMNGIDVYAMHEDNATVYVNDSPFYTEFLLKNRLSLMPIIYENVNNKRIEIHLCSPDDLSKPLKNNTIDNLSVTLNEFQVFEVLDNGDRQALSNEEIFLYPNMEVLWLKPYQQIHLKYDGVKRGNGYEHSMYQTFRISNYSMSGSNRYGEPQEITMVMESLGRIDPINALNSVLNNMINKVENFRKNIIDIGSGTNISMIDDHYMQVILLNESFTLCNIIKYYIMKYLDNMTGNKDDFTRLFNVSSNQTHPLKKEFKIQIQLYEPYALNGEQEFKEVILKACDAVIQDLSKLIEEL
jgi:DNA-directed RNA polymerase subunit L